MEPRHAASPQPLVTEMARRASHLARAVVTTSLRARSRRSLPSLAESHPRASQASRRWRGVGVVPVSAIVGTASVRPGTRMVDFLPTAGHESADWQSRWQRLQAAARDLTPLPPIELVKAGDGYWVVDGHNRVALAKATGQEWIDADVTEVTLPTASIQSTTAQRGIT